MKQVFAQYTGATLSSSGTVSILEELVEGDVTLLKFVRHFAAAVDADDAQAVCKAAVESENARRAKFEEDKEARIKDAIR